MTLQAALTQGPQYEAHAQSNGRTAHVRLAYESGPFDDDVLTVYRLLFIEGDNPLDRPSADWTTLGLVTVATLDRWTLCVPDNTGVALDWEPTPLMLGSC